MSAHSPDQWTLVMLHAPIAAALALTYKAVKKAPPASRVAVSLETRRVGDYLWWPGEALMAAVIAASWMLFIRGDARVEWVAPVEFTYCFIGLLLFEIWIVLRGVPLPAERAEEHRQWMEEGRRLSIRVWRIWRWFLVTMLAAYALLHDPDVGAAGPWVFRVAVGVTFALIAAFVVTMVRGTFWMFNGMKRGLRFEGIWSGPFRKSRWMPRGGLILIAAWFGGLILLIAVSLS